MTDKVELLTPAGRMVQGHPFEEQTKDANGAPLVVKTGPNAGQARSEYFFAIAIPKNDPEWAALWGQIYAVGQAAFPGGEFNTPAFAWKVKDGDDPKHANKTGFPGHWIINCSSGFLPKVYTRNGEAQIVDPKQIKRGDYIRAYISIKGNGSPLQPGVFINPSMVEIIGYGEEIITGPSGEQVFGGAPVAGMPAGASATPTAPSTTIAPPTPAAAAPPVPAAAAPAAPAAPAAAPVTAGAPPAPGAATAAPAAAPAAPAGPTMTPKAGATTYAQYIAAGWNDAQLIENGLMTAPVAPAPDFLTGAPPAPAA